MKETDCKDVELYMGTGISERLSSVVLMDDRALTWYVDKFRMSAKAAGDYEEMVDRGETNLGQYINLWG